MNVSGVSSSQIPIPSLSSADAKRAMLQTALLKKALELQNTQAQEIQRETEGKGQTLDIRV
jgi:hypothetical protein